MSDLIARLQDMVDFKHDDMDVAREAIEEIARLRAALATAQREGMEAAVSEAQARAKFWVSGNNEEAKIRYDEARKIAAAIRGALTGGKDEK